MCFLAVIGCLRPTIDFETLRRDPKLVFQFVKDKISSVNGDKYVNIADFPPWKLKHTVGVFAESLRSMVCLSQPTTVWKHIRGASFQGYHGVILVDLDAVGHKFAANFWPETVEKTDFFVKIEIFTNILLLTFFLKEPVHSIAIGQRIQEKLILWM